MNRSVNIYYLNEAKKEKKEVKQSFMDKVKDKAIGVGKHLKKNWKTYALGGAAAAVTANNIHNIVSRKSYNDNAVANDNAETTARINNNNKISTAIAKKVVEPIQVASTKVKLVGSDTPTPNRPKTNVKYNKLSGYNG